MGGGGDETAAATAAAASDVAALQLTALRLLSSAVASHPSASERLLSRGLGLNLPARLVSSLQRCVHALTQSRHAPHAHVTASMGGRGAALLGALGEAGPSPLDPPLDPPLVPLVRESLLLLLELARSGGEALMSGLDGGSWRADLTGVTLSLVRNEVHPSLADLSTPAKLLQNAMTMPPRSADRRSSGSRRRRRPAAA
jgi:hypothetical protein